MIFFKYKKKNQFLIKYLYQYWILTKILKFNYLELDTIKKILQDIDIGLRKSVPFE